MTTVLTVVALMLACLWLFWRWSRRLFWVVLVLGVAWTVDALWIEPRRLVVTRYSLPVAGLTAPVRAVVIGDPQPIRMHWSPERLRIAFAEAASQQPDIVLWLGDYAYDPHWSRSLGIEDWNFVPPADTVAAMATIEAPMGAYAVLGNHDWWWNGPEVKRLLGRTHITVLVDRAVRAEHPKTGAALWIAGLDDLSTPRRYDLAGTLGQTDPSAPVLLLSHSPDIFPQVPASVALTLSGHTHGGQVLIPGFGRPIVPIRHRQYAYGLFEEGARRLLVTAGIGTAILPLRFLTPPEIVVLDLVPARPGSGRLD